MRAIRTAFVAMAILALGSCNIFIGIFGASHVTLSTAKTVLNSGEIVRLTATVSNLSGILVYEWYEDGIALGVNSSTYDYSKFVTASQDITIKVTVTNGSGETFSDSIVLTVIRPSSSATIQIYNDSSYEVHYLFISPASSGFWGPDQLRPDQRIYPGGSILISGVPSTSAWDLRAVSIYSTYTWTRYGKPNNYPFYIKNGEWD